MLNSFRSQNVKFPANGNDLDTRVTIKNDILISN